MVRVLLHESVVDDVRTMLQHAHEGPGDAATVELVGIDSHARGADLATAQAAIRWDLDDEGLRRLLGEATELRWLHSPSAGVEGWPLGELAARDIVLTNAAGVFAIPIAEWVLATMLAVVKHSYDLRAAQLERRWAGDVQSDELNAKTLLMLGTGGIAAQVIERARAFGMRILAANRSGRPVDGAVVTVKGDAWKDLLPEADFVVSTLPLTPQTKGMIGAPELKLFKRGAWLLNVGRGATLDEDALLEALRSETIGGAALDAWITEPLPADHPAWSLPNMIVSPHVSGATAAGRQRGLGVFVDNLTRFVGGRPLLNVVELSQGY